MHIVTLEQENRKLKDLMSKNDGQSREVDDGSAKYNKLEL